jgi:hypothetical protein
VKGFDDIILRLNINFSNELSILQRRDLFGLVLDLAFQKKIRFPKPRLERWEHISGKHLIGTFVVNRRGCVTNRDFISFDLDPGCLIQFEEQSVNYLSL